MTIYVGNLSFQAEQEDLVDLFGQYGEVRQCSLPLDRETGRKRGFAFVELASDAEEQKAIDDLQDVEWMGRMIRVNKATPVSAPEAVEAAAAVVVTAVAAALVPAATEAEEAAVAVVAATAVVAVTAGEPPGASSTSSAQAMPRMVPPGEEAVLLRRP
ncbi:RNA recognition motif domain-containing protein [Cyanobium sp. ATX-6F1]|uniref:RNA recognition motif domain-containing protein n=1 Tax=Cyanobium sp. ATX-6F1 TaxID=3137388 RepID=UPI0039BE15F9